MGLEFCRMPQVYAIDGIVPVVDPTAYVHPSGVLIGDVILAPRAYIGPCASLHGCVIRRGAPIGMNAEFLCKGDLRP